MSVEHTLLFEQPAGHSAYERDISFDEALKVCPFLGQAALNAPNELALMRDFYEMELPAETRPETRQVDAVTAKTRLETVSVIPDELNLTTTPELGGTQVQDWQMPPAAEQVEETLLPTRSSDMESMIRQEQTGAVAEEPQLPNEVDSVPSLTAPEVKLIPEDVAELQTPTIVDLPCLETVTDTFSVEQMAQTPTEPNAFAPNPEPYTVQSPVTTEKSTPKQEKVLPRVIMNPVIEAINAEDDVQPSATVELFTSPKVTIDDVLGTFSNAEDVDDDDELSLITLPVPAPVVPMPTIDAESLHADIAMSPEPGATHEAESDFSENAVHIEVISPFKKMVLETVTVLPPEEKVVLVEKFQELIDLEQELEAMLETGESASDILTEIVIVCQQISKLIKEDGDLSSAKILQQLLPEATYRRLVENDEIVIDRGMHEIINVMLAGALPYRNDMTLLQALVGRTALIRH